MNPSPLRIGLVADGEPLDGAALARGALGGSETALVQMAGALAARGHRVQVFCPCPQPGEYGGVRYRHYQDLVRAAGEERFEVLVVSRFFPALDLPLQAGLKVLWNHDILDDPAALAARLERLDLLMVLSRFQAADYAGKLPACQNRLWITRNGLDLDLLARARAGVEPAPGRVTYVSRPERGLKQLLKYIWPRLRAQLPSLELRLCGYQVQNTALPPAVAREHREIEDLLAQTPGVKRLGPLAKEDYYRHLASCSALLYPCVFPEISCIAALEAQALDLPLVTSDGFALSETVVEPWFKVPGRPQSREYQDAFVERALEVLTQSSKARALAARAGETVRARHDWRVIAAAWEERFTTWLEQRQSAQGPQLAASLLLSGDAAVAEQLLGRSLTLPQEDLVPPDQEEAALQEALAGLLGPALAQMPLDAGVGVLAADGGRTRAALAAALAPRPVIDLDLETPPGAPLAAVVLRDRLERDPHPAGLLERALARCLPLGRLLVCAASGAWPLLAPGYLSRRHDLGRDELQRLLPGRDLATQWVPAGLVGAGGQRLFAGRWLVLAPAAGPPPGDLDPRGGGWRVRPAAPELQGEVQRAGLM